MNAVAWIVGVLLICVFAFAGGTKVIDLDRQREHFGFTVGQYRLIGLAELAAALGIAAGLVWRSLEFVSIAASVGVCALMVGALMAHARVDDDARDTIPAAVVFALAVLMILALALR